MGPHVYSLAPQEVVYLILAKRLEMERSRVLQVRANLRQRERERVKDTNYSLYQTHAEHASKHRKEQGTQRTAPSLTPAAKGAM